MIDPKKSSRVIIYDVPRTNSNEEIMDFYRAEYRKVYRKYCRNKKKIYRHCVMEGHAFKIVLIIAQGIYSFW